MTGLGLIYFSTQQSGDTLSKNWTKTDKFVRWAQYIPAVFFGQVIQVSVDGQNFQQLNPSRFKFFLPLVLLTGAVVYLGLQKIALIAAVVAVIASIIGVVVMGRSELQATYNNEYVQFVDKQKNAVALTNALKDEDVQGDWQEIVKVVKNKGWWTNNSIVEDAIKTFQENCTVGTETTRLIKCLLAHEDQQVFNCVFECVVNLLMKNMTSREQAITIMEQVVKAEPCSGDEEIQRFQNFIKQLVYRARGKWTSEICDTVKDNSVALKGVLEGLTKSEGSIGKAIICGFTVDMLEELINKGKLSPDTHNDFKAELQENAQDLKFTPYKERLISTAVEN